MPNLHEFLKTVPFDLYELSLFQLVARERSFTKAAAAAGLTQSAITRQIQGIEQTLGLALLERTTRSVQPTPAGEFLLRESTQLLGDVERSLQRLREEFAGARKIVRVGLSRSIAHAYLPGFFHANLRRRPGLQCRVSFQPAADIVRGIEGNEIDLGVITAPRRLPATVRAVHRFNDDFTLIAGDAAATEFAALPRRAAARTEWLRRQTWLLPDPATATGERLRAWMKRQGWTVEPAMQLDSFDALIGLVALGMGVSFVPIRALALYGRRRALRRLKLPERFSRELVVLVRRHRQLPIHVAEFAERILF